MRTMDDTKTETAEERERLLSQLGHPTDRKMVEGLLASHPGLTAAECIEHLRAMGASKSGPGLEGVCDELLKMPSLSQ